MSLGLLESVHRVGHCCHHLHLEVVKLFRGQWWRVRQRVATPLVTLASASTGSVAPCVDHLFVAETP